MTKYIRLALFYLFIYFFVENANFSVIYSKRQMKHFLSYTSKIKVLFHFPIFLKSLSRLIFEIEKPHSNRWIRHSIFNTNDARKCIFILFTWTYDVSDFVNIFDEVQKKNFLWIMDDVNKCVCCITRYVSSYFYQQIALFTRKL